MIVVAIVPNDVGSALALTNANPEPAAFAASGTVNAQPHGSAVLGSVSVGQNAYAPEVVKPEDKTADYAY